MNATEITARINKVKAEIEKIENLIAKREADLPKAKETLAKADFETEKNKWWDAHFKVMHLEEGIENGKYKLNEKRNTLKTYQERLEKVNAENRKLTEIPEQLKALQEQIAKELTEENINLRNEMRKDRQEMTRDDFFRKYMNTNIAMVYNKTDEEIIREAEKDAKHQVLNLVSRVQKKVGEITSWNLYSNGRELNGKVEGTKGTAKIETIYAWGDVQRLHTRVLVK